MIVRVILILFTLLSIPINAYDLGKIMNGGSIMKTKWNFIGALITDFILLTVFYLWWDY